MSAGTRSQPKGQEHITGLNTAKSLTPPVGAIYALIQPRTQAVWITNDGTTPSATNGIQLVALQILEYDGILEQLRVIEVAASATLSVMYFGL